MWTGGAGGAMPQEGLNSAAAGQDRWAASLATGMPTVQHRERHRMQSEEGQGRAGSRGLGMFNDTQRMRILRSW
jgi:hypothetical protein